MIEKALKKLTDELKKEKSFHDLSVLVEYLKERMKEDPSVAEAVLQEGKTLGGVYTAMKEVARKKAKSGSYCMAATESLKIVDEYYGLAKKSDPVKPQESQTSAKREEELVSLFDLV